MISFRKISQVAAASSEHREAGSVWDASFADLDVVQKQFAQEAPGVLSRCTRCEP